jgi:hypothetical protein
MHLSGGQGDTVLLIGSRALNSSAVPAFLGVHVCACVVDGQIGVTHFDPSRKLVLTEVLVVWYGRARNKMT